VTAVVASLSHRICTSLLELARLALGASLGSHGSLISLEILETTLVLLISLPLLKLAADLLLHLDVG
jgi:hypothetical protein